MTNLLSLQAADLAEYQDWLHAVKQRIISTRMRVALAANRELILFYWDLGALISRKQEQSQWGRQADCAIVGGLAKSISGYQRFVHF